MIQESAHSYAQNKLMPRVLDNNRNESFDKSIFKLIKHLETEKNKDIDKKFKKAIK